MKDKFDVDGSAKWTWIQTKIQLVIFVVQDLFFNEVVRICDQGNKALINWVGRSVQDRIALSLSLIYLPSVGQYGKGRGQYIPALASHSVNKSIW